MNLLSRLGTRLCSHTFPPAAPFLLCSSPIITSSAPFLPLFFFYEFSFSTSSSLRPAFCCHDSGATVLAMAPRNQLLITGGRKGWISILELPHKLQRQSFQAHDSPVKALAVDPTEDCFISGSSEGNIRVIISHSPAVRLSVGLLDGLSSLMPASKVCPRDNKPGRPLDNVGELDMAHFL